MLAGSGIWPGPLLTSIPPVFLVVPLMMSAAKNWPSAFCSRLASVRPVAVMVKVRLLPSGVLGVPVPSRPYSKNPVPVRSRGTAYTSSRPPQAPVGACAGGGEAGARAGGRWRRAGPTAVNTAGSQA